MTPVKSIFLETNHLFLRNPRGGVEEVRDMRAAGFGAIFCNIGDHTPREWTTVRTRAQEAGVICGPWLRTIDANNNFSHDKLDYLVQVADEWRSPLIVNSESELKGSDSMLTSLIAATLKGRDAAISVEPWPFSNVAWWPLGRFPFLPQIFPVEADAAKQPEACKEKWHDYGVECVVFTFGSYRGMQASDFKRLTPYGVYTADDCGGNYADWRSQGVCVPCMDTEPEPPEEDVEKIGSQHGVKAWYNRMKVLDPDYITPEFDPENYNAIPADKLKAHSKLCRALMIVVKNNDEIVDTLKRT